MFRFLNSYRCMLGVMLTFTYMMAMTCPLMPLVVYYMNYDYIAEELCKNKDKPKMECHGSCFMSTIIDDLDTQPSEEKPNTKVVLDMREYPISTLDFFSYTPSEQSVLEGLLPPILKAFFIEDPYVFSIFHPPRFIG